MAIKTLNSDSNDSELLGLLGGMKDEMISQFRYEGVYFYRTMGNIAVSPEGPPQDMAERTSLEEASLTELEEWVEEKAEEHGD